MADRPCLELCTHLVQRCTECDRRLAREVAAIVHPESLATAHRNIEPTSVRSVTRAVTDLPLRVPSAAIRDATRFVNHIAPSGPDAIRSGTEPAVRAVSSVTTPVGVMRPMLYDRLPLAQPA